MDVRKLPRPDGPGARGRALMEPDAEAEALLGVETDGRLAERLGVSSALVCRWRRARGIPPHRPGRPRAMTHAEWREALERRRPGMAEALLRGDRSVAAVGREHGVRREYARQILLRLRAAQES
jgi:transposase-like protein